jgi:putative endopeptidase
MPCNARLVAFPIAATLFLGASPLLAQAPAVPAFNPADIDSTCKPCDNFYRFANDGWKKRTPIPAAFSAWGSFDELTQRNYESVRGILESAAREASTTSDGERRRLGRFYASCMDSAAVEASGAQPIRDDLARIDGISSPAQLREALVRLHRAGSGVLFGSGSTQDARDSRRVIFAVRQGGLGLPDRDYYFRTDTSTVALKAAYRDHIGAMLGLLGIAATEASTQADQVLALETALAKKSMNRLQQRDPNAQYNMMSVAAADQLTPGFSWASYHRALGITAVDSFNVAHPEFFRALASEMETRPLAHWKAYLRYHVANGTAPWLSRAFVNQNFAFSARITGARELQPRWRRCLGVTDGLLTDALGREYVRVAYTPEAKAAMGEMIDNLMVVYRRRLQALPWMGEETRQQALRKLGTFGRKIGYPDTWRSYAELDVQPSGWFGNLRRAVVFRNQNDLRKVGKPVDRGEWRMTPPTVNAYYSAQNNEIGFPAGRLQPPFFHPSYDLGANYGGIGATIGHEVSHGFDDQGRKFDADGNLRDWWTADDATRFGELAGQIERQYTAYTVLDGLPLNGKQTLGENIADNAGVSIAYEALQLALQGKPRTTVDGFTPEQRFFLGWAQARRTNFRDAALRLQVQTGVHSPGEFRVNGPLSNMPEFAAAFGCKKGEAMVRDQPAKIW